ncbi:urease accessory protein UreD [Pelagovum pacificum]|uniref:Urease accessory protein UreD n=2 Tax=Pelagovum pacificum TaxID=2588711 RepID=A0A5C5GDN6_9RHOB|nr:urease accessory protein UreD [Pelagovum pacificum]TNY31689.1 urease accessory protein UreD [Pelagovum pacificum]
MKLLFPRPSATALEAVALNTSGGLTGGDRLSLEIGTEPGAALTFSTQAAERAYASTGDVPAQMTTSIHLAGGSRLDWLPQETILFDRARLSRRLTVEMACDARLTLVEPVILGRVAMGERCGDVAFRDSWDIRRDGKLIYADRTRLDGDVSALLARTGAGAGAYATLVHVAPDAERHLAPLRATLPAPSGVSLLRDGVLVARLLTEDGFALRSLIVPAIERLTDGPVPKVWRL